MMQATELNGKAYPPPKSSSLTRCRPASAQDSERLIELPRPGEHRRRAAWNERIG